MKIKISSPEILIASACVLLFVGHQLEGWIFAATGVLGAVMRVSIEHSIRAEKIKRDQELYRSIFDIVDSVLQAISSMASTHIDDTDDSHYN